jgi:hypothetical protein
VDVDGCCVALGEREREVTEAYGRCQETPRVLTDPVVGNGDP